MAIRGVVPDRVTPVEQGIWIVIAVLLCVVEMYALKRADDDHDKLEADVRWAEDLRSDVERRSFRRLIDSGQQLHVEEERTSRLTQEGLNNMTGADSYVYFSVSEPMGPLELATPGLPKGNILSNASPHFVGTYPLHNVFVSGECPRGVLPDIDYGTVFPKEMGRPRQGLYLQFPADIPERSATCNIFISTSNGSYSQSVHFIKQDDKWVWASKFGKYGKSKLRLSFFGAGFPRSLQW